MCDVAAKTGAETIGYEVMPIPVRFGQQIIRKFTKSMSDAGAALTHVPVLHEKSFFDADLANADVVSCHTTSATTPPPLALSQIIATEPTIPAGRYSQITTPSR
jgi:hypothetical protein